MMPESPCDVCGIPDRKVGHCVEGKAGLQIHLLGNRVELLRCAGCGSLWCYASHGEDASTPAGLHWPYTTADWQRAYDLDDGVSLRRWHFRNMKENSLTVDHPCGRRVCKFRSTRKKTAPAKQACGSVQAEKIR